MLLSYGAGEDSWESNSQGDQSKEIQPVHSKGNQSWIFIGRTDAEAEAPKLWPPDAKSWLIGKDPDAGKDWRGEEKGTTEEEVVEWHHWFNGHEFEQTVRDGEVWSTACNSRGHKELDTTERVNNNKEVTENVNDPSEAKRNIHLEFTFRFWWDLDLKSNGESPVNSTAINWMSASSPKF